jgi:transcriptional regulator GlxA family with amidase domain
MAFMHENLHRDISRDQVAEVAHLSPAHFSRIFKKEMRESFTDMLNRMRIDQAAELLARTERSLCMVALDCGFKDQSYFTKVFRKYLRTTPREYRLRLQSARKNSG